MSKGVVKVNQSPFCLITTSAELVASYVLCKKVTESQTIISTMILRRGALGVSKTYCSRTAGQKVISCQP
jgi:hypothetical protein